jgi:hypothetical protein
MGFGKFQYNEAARPKKADAAIKLRHIWLPLAFLLYSLYRNQRITELSFVEASVGMTIALLSFLPLFIWASSKEREIPAFQAFCAIHFPFYAYPIISCKAAYMMYPEPERLMACSTVVVFLGLAILIYYGGRHKLGAKRPSGLLQYRQVSDEKARVLFSCLLVAWVVYLTSKSFGLIRIGTAANTLNSFAQGGGLVAMFSLARQIGEKKLTQAHAFFVVLCITGGIVISTASGSLSFSIIFIIVPVVGYSLSRRQVPWAAIVIALGIIAFLNLGKSDLRKVFWRRGGHVGVMTVEKMFNVYETWIPASWNVLMRGGGPKSERNTQSLLDRANLIHMQTLVTHTTPERLPHLWGETYVHIPLCIVPRLLWPDKPHGHISTQTLGLYYGVTSLKQVRTTTIGFGLLAEAWANFGWAGVFLLAVVVGSSMRYVANACVGAHPTSIHALLAIVWVSQSFQIEQCLSSWIASFFMSCFAIFILMYPFSYAAKLVRPGMAVTTSYSH